MNQESPGFIRGEHQQIDTLKMWAGYVDGFRCDVAPLIPLEFWLAAREAVRSVRPDCLWLSESVEPAFTRENRRRGMSSLSDAELFRAFDVSYEYDVYPDWIEVLKGRLPLSRYLEKLNEQETVYPGNYVKLRFLENHDRPRACFCVPDRRARENWTAFLFFNRGMTLLYNGQEAECVHRPGLFEKDPVEWDTGRDISGRLRTLAGIKRHPLMREGSYHVCEGGRGIIVAEYRRGGSCLFGVFSAGGSPGIAGIDAPDGVYTNLLGGPAVHVEQGLVCHGGAPPIFEVG